MESSGTTLTASGVDVGRLSRKFTLTHTHTHHTHV